MESAFIRRLRPSDVEAVRTLDLASHREAWPAQTIIEHSTDPRFLMLVAVEPVDAGQHLGHAFAHAVDRTYLITNVAVSAEHAGRGIATRLITRLLAERPADCDLVRLQVRPGNRRAQRLYVRLGFAPVGVIRDFYPRALGHANRDAIEMTLRAGVLTDPAVAARIPEPAPYAGAEQ